MKDLPTVSVVIPHYNDLAGLRICLASLAAQTYPRDLVEIIVADNASPIERERIEAAIEGRARLEVVRDRGAGPARNGGVAASQGEVLAFIDSDCVAEPEWIEKGVEALDAYSLVGGRVRVLVQDETRLTPVEAFERVFAFDFETYINKKGFTGAGNLFCTRATFDTVGGFRVGLSEDVEWSRRAVAAGYRLGYAPAAVVGHPARRTWDELTRKWRRLNLETFGLWAGTPLRGPRWFLRSLALPLSAVVHTPKVLASPELRRTADRLKAIGVLFAIRFWRLADALRLLGAAGKPQAGSRPASASPAETS